MATVKAKKVLPVGAPGLAAPSAVPSDVKHPRMLIIEFIGDAPQIVWKGDWSVRHLLTIKRCIGREFKKYRRDVIRTNITKEGAVL